MAFQVSPGVNVSEVDLTSGIPAISVSTGAHVGNFNWGPVLLPTQISSEVELAKIFGDVNNNTAVAFLTCASFLAYSSDLTVVREDATNQFNATANGTGVVINNENIYFSGNYLTNVPGNPWSARYPGIIGNSLQVLAWANGTVWTANSSNTADPLYTFANYFDRAPGTSPYVSSITNGLVTGDEIHILVIDQDGLFTGVANTVVEKYEGLSKCIDALNTTGGSNFYKNVIWSNSSYIYNLGVPSANTQGWGTQVLSIPIFGSDANANVAILTGGADGTHSDANVINGLTLLANPGQVDISLLFTGGHDNVVQSYAISDVAAARKDCVAFCSPPLANTQDVTGPAQSIANYVNNNGLFFSSYGVMDSGWKYMYDKYNDVYRWIPLNGDVAGLCAYTDQIRDPWWSPAGLQRGVIKNCVKLAFNPAMQSDRDTLYKAGVNPVVSFPGEGTILFGDKTFLNYASAFDRINVRRLFIVLEKTISIAARASLFEFNDTFTRAAFVNLITPFLRTVQGRRGITDFRVVCDTTNNTPDIIDANQFVGDIYIKPARSINYIQLNFVAVRTGVSFSEVVGSF